MRFYNYILLLSLVTLITSYQLSYKEFDKSPTSFLFSILDSNKDGILQPQELYYYLDEYFADKMSDKDIYRFFKELDIDFDSHVTYDEFKNKLMPKEKSVEENEPQQIHISFTGRPGEMRVMWITRSNIQYPTVRWGERPDQLNRTVIATSDTYNIGIDGWKGWIHTADIRLTSQAPIIYYQVGSENTWSDLKHFTTHSYNPGPVRIAIYGDMGTIPFGWKVSEKIENDSIIKPYDAIVHMGDIAYASDGKVFEIQLMWDYFGRQIESYASLMPYMTGVGNHEAYSDFHAFSKRFNMTAQYSGGHRNFWWSFDVGFAHFTMISSEHDYSPGSPQYEWIKNDLEKANSRRNIRPWIFVTAHKPMYSTHAGRYGNSQPGAKFQKYIEPLLQQYKVDIMLTGHNHHYERTHPTNNGKSVMKDTSTYVNPPYPIWIVQGTAGPITEPNYITPSPEWSAVRISEYGYGRLTIHNSSSLQYEFIDAYSGNINDELWIHK